MSTNEIRFCSNCGTKLVDGAKFCFECGTPVGGSRSENKEQRQQEYAGKILKCPNCGATIDGMAAICPSCGFHITQRDASISVQKFQEELMKIECSRNLGNKLTDKIWGLIGERSNVDIQKTSLIQTYPIPNTIEEISEFMYLAAANINVNLSKKTFTNNQNRDMYKAERSISNAWVSKLEQLYRKAEATFPNAPAFEHIKEVYYAKMKELKMKVK